MQCCHLEFMLTMQVPEEEAHENGVVTKWHDMSKYEKLTKKLIERERSTYVRTLSVQFGKHLFQAEEEQCENQIEYQKQPKL